MSVERFQVGQRVRVCDENGEFDGITGTVGRACNRGPDPWAWVALDRWPEHAERAYPADDELGRGNWVMVYAGECEPEEAVVAVEAA